MRNINIKGCLPQHHELDHREQIGAKIASEIRARRQHLFACAQFLCNHSKDFSFDPVRQAKHGRSVVKRPRSRINK